MYAPGWIAVRRYRLAMRISPRYDGSPIIDVDDVMADPSAACIRQRNRFADTLEQLTDEQWSGPTRCDGWSVQDVVEHLDGVNGFWVFSIESGLRGEPTKVLATFDPVAVPAQMVESARGATPAETLARFRASNARLAECLGGIEADAWSTPAEAPPGHIAVRALVMHGLWDSWIHERDVLLPLGREQEVEPDELLGALAYAAALSPAFHVNSGSSEKGTFQLVAHDPEIALTVEVGSEVTVSLGAVEEADAHIEGDAVEILESLSCRAPQPELPEAQRWFVTGLADVFAG
jgi:uncharacterized protein (TIGR03083 family)